MKTRNTCLRPLFAGLSVLALAATSAHATTLLSIDFGAGGAEPGFTQQSTTDRTDHSTTAGTITVAVAGSQAFYTAATSGTNDALYKDFIFKNNGTMTLSLTGAGISASTSYNLSFWSYYTTEARNTIITGSAGTVGAPLGPIATSNAAPLSLTDPRYFTTGAFVSDATGNLTFALSSAPTFANRPLLNGFRIDTVPEPSVALLGGLGFLCLLRRRR